MSGITGTQAELLYTLPAPVTKNNYSAAAVFSAPAATAPVAKIQGGLLASDPGPVGRSFLLEATGTIANAATGYTFVPEVAFNQTAGTVSAFVAPCYAATAPTASITAQWWLKAYITCQAAGETGGTTFQVNTRWDQSAVASGAALQPAATSGWNAQSAANITGLSAGVTNYVELVGIWSVASASATTTVQQMFLWCLN